MKRRFKNDEIVVDDFELVDALHCRGTADKSSGFGTSSDNDRPHPLLIAINQYLQNPKVPLKTVELIFAKFLVELSRVANDLFYAMSASVMRMLHECLSIYGYHFLIKLEQQNKGLGKVLTDDEKQDSFCEKESTDYISVVFDFFIKSFLPNYLKTRDFEIDFVIKFLKYLNNWLFKYNFSKIELGYNSYN